MNWLIDDLKCVTAVFLIITLACFYTYLKINYSYWDRKGFKTLPGTVFFFGHIKSNFFGKEMMANIVKNLYDKTSEPFIGFYALLRPILIIRDTQLIRNILVKDFTYFRDRGVYVNEKDDPLSGHLVALGGEKWRFLRTKLTPTFTSGKLKGMFGTLVDCGTNLQTYLGKLSDQNEVLDVQEIAASHATNVIASVSFGLDVDAITNPDTDFRTFGRKMFTPTIQNSFRIMLLTCAPKLMKFFRVKCVSSDVEKFVLSIVKQNLIYREENKVTRKDFFQLLIQLRNGEKISEESDDWNSTIKSNENQKTFTVNEMAAQSYIFFAAGKKRLTFLFLYSNVELYFFFLFSIGFETSSSTLSFCLNELAKNPEIQSRVYEEINRVLEKHGGEITYDSVAEMKYLENCIDGRCIFYLSIFFRIIFLANF